MKKFASAALTLILLFGGCSLFEKEGSFQLYLTDQPIDGLEHVYVTFSAIRVEKDDGKVITLHEGEFTLDLLALRDIEEQILDVDLEAGTYTAVILVINSVSIVVNGQTFNLNIELNLEVRVLVNFTITNDRTTEVVLDFDAEQSLEGYGGYYTMIPVITVKRIG